MTKTRMSVDKILPLVVLLYEIGTQILVRALTGEAELAILYSSTDQVPETLTSIKLIMKLILPIAYKYL